MDTRVNPMEGFHRLSAAERIRRLSEFCSLTDSESAILSGQDALPLEIAENLIENVIGVFPMPLGVATHFRIDGRDLFIPMAVEETSIIAAASATAKWVKEGGEIVTSTLGRRIIGQVQLPNVNEPDACVARLKEKQGFLIARANEFLPGLVARGGGVQELAFRVLERADAQGSMLVIHVLCDPCDAMGANLINQVCEGLKPDIEGITGEKVGLCILSNLVDGKLARARIRIRGVDPMVARGIQEATQFAKTDPYRATTHNKGVLNGIDPILIATGNDWRAVEAGVHAYAARSGKYQPVTDWVVEGADLVGTIEIPLALGTVGGVTRAHPTARIALKILGIERAEDLARIVAAVGLTQNLGALRALATVGIVKGHMQLHAANLAIAAGAEAHEIPRVRERLTHVLKTQKRIGLSHAKEILESIRGSIGP